MGPPPHQCRNEMVHGVSTHCTCLGTAVGRWRSRQGALPEGTFPSCRRARTVQDHHHQCDSTRTLGHQRADRSSQSIMYGSDVPRSPTHPLIACSLLWRSPLPPSTAGGGLCKSPALHYISIINRYVNAHTDQAKRTSSCSETAAQQNSGIQLHCWCKLISLHHSLRPRHPSAPQAVASKPS